MIAAMHVPGASLLHRTPAGWKLLALAALGTGLFFVASPWILGACAALAFLAYPVCGLGWGRGWAQIRAMAFFLALIAGSQAWLAGWASAMEVTARLITLILGASLVTFTTPLSALMETLERILTPLRHLGVQPQALAFALTLTIRFIPVLMALAQETKEAMIARGRERAWFAMAVPLVIRALRMADQVAEAVEARGLDVVIEAHSEAHAEPQPDGRVDG
ncbi:energy-coupling factor transporter transmembrane component T family protein [Rhodospirillum sp. A1_3_36]|uniref:energy-coupling factor transporter transmembrane component T family protein n=1 Tax=Rhodospirillum sp. A1_3_36 TaxID=3391666 RepID=UPI0039A51D9D